MVNIVRILLDLLSGILTFFLLTYGFVKGFNMLELVVYIIYGIVMVISMIWKIYDYFGGKNEI
jgi:hypothetical protein